MIIIRQVIHRSKIRVLKMLIIVVILFAFCWLPLYAVNIRVYLGPPMDTVSFEFDLVTQTIIPFAQWLGLSSCSVNPVVYCLFSGKFRAGYRSLIVSKTCCRACANESSSSTQSSPSMVSTRFVAGGNRRFHSQIPLGATPDSASPSPSIHLLGRSGYVSTKSTTNGRAIAVNIITTTASREPGDEDPQCKNTGRSRCFVRSRYDEDYYGQQHQQLQQQQQRQYLNEHCRPRMRRVQQTFI
jgi:7 transmembrane receptor (rhodopsin family)